MNRSIPPSFIKDLLSITDIVNVINSKIELKKKGKNYYALCPFHNENTPSFTVSKEKQFFYCFGCNINGNVIDFLIKYDNLSFVESIEEIANLNNLKIPFYKKNSQIQKKNNYCIILYKIMQNLNYIYVKTLFMKTTAIKYLESRGINKKIIKLFSIGYVDFNWFDMLKKYNIVKKDKIKKYLFDLGTLKNSEKGYLYNIFINRITFPIRNKKGNIVAFGGRTINEKIPKYINSAENLIFNKSNNVYGLYEIYKQNKKPPYLLVVEGYIDVLSLVQHDIIYSVAILGTSINDYHIKILFNETEKIIFCYDGDIAGKKAAWNSLKLALTYMYDGRKLYFIFLPKGEDPDSIILKEGKEKFLERIKQAISFSDFLFSILIKKINIKKFDELAKLAKLALPMINKIPGEILRIYMRKELGKKLGIMNDEILDKFLSKKKINISSHIYLKKTNMRILIGLLIQNTKLIKIISRSCKNLEKLKIPGINLFTNLINICIKNPNINTGQLIEFYRNTPHFVYLKKLASWKHMIATEKIENVFYDTLTKMHNLVLQQRLDELIVLDKVKGLTLKERSEFWKINLLSKKNK